MKGTLAARAGDARPGAAIARRVVLLGASNLTKSIGTVVDTAAGIWGGPVEVLAAWGHGRSYGRATWFLGLEMPGIEACGLWADLNRAAEVPAAALVTDIGNDLVYEEPVERIVGWVERCFDRLAAAGATTIVTRLPIDNLRTLSPARFRLLRTLFFPRSRISLAEVGRRAAALDDAVRRLAIERGFRLVDQRPDWYGFDPIHIRLGRRRAVWREILSGWSAERQTLAPAPRVLARSVYLRTRTPERRRLLGFEQRGRKPAAVLADGTTVAIY